MDNELFGYQNDEISAKHINAAMTKFLDEAWGVHYVEYLKEKGRDTKNIYVVDDLADTEDQEYYLLKQELENGAVLKFEIWVNDDGSYKGLAQEVEVKKILCATCNNEIEDDYLKIGDNFMIVKFFEEDEHNIFCSEECLCKCLSVGTVEFETGKTFY